MKKRIFLILISALLVSCNKISSTTSSSSSSSNSIISSITSSSTSSNSINSSTTTSSSSSQTSTSSTTSSSSTSTSLSTSTSSTTSSSTTTSSSSSSSTGEDYLTPDGRKNIFDNTEIGDPNCYAIGRVVKIEEFKYNDNVNVYIQDGKYTYQAINVNSYSVEIGKDYMVYGKKKSSPSYGFRIDASGDVAISMVGMEEMYGVVDPIFSKVTHLNELETYPAVIDFDNVVITNKDNISISSSFDKYSFVVTKGIKEYVIECQKGKDDGIELVNYIYNLPLGTSISFKNLIVFSSSLGRITSVNDIELDLSDEDRVNKVKEELVIPDSLENDILLPTSKLGCDISWSSSNDKYLSNNGKVTRPLFGEDDVTINLTATIKYGNIQQQKIFSIKIKAIESDEKYNEPFISVYVEGSGSNKVIGIKNPSSDALDLSKYSIKAVTSSSAKEYKLTGTLCSNDTLYLINKASTLLNYFESTTHVILTNDVVNFNGDDALCLFKEGELIDIIGDLETKPSAGWVISGNITTKNHTLVRSSSVKKGNTIFDASEWIGYDQDNIDFLNN